MKYLVKALEKFVVITQYEVEADNKIEAEQLCKTGRVDYIKSSIQEGDEEWLESVEIEEM